MTCIFCFKKRSKFISIGILLNTAFAIHYSKKKSIRQTNSYFGTLYIIYIYVMDTTLRVLMCLKSYRDMSVYILSRKKSFLCVQIETEMNTNGMMRTILRFTAVDEQMCVLCAQKEFYRNSYKFFSSSYHKFCKTFLTCHCVLLHHSATRVTDRHCRT